MNLKPSGKETLKIRTTENLLFHSNLLKNLVVQPAGSNPPNYNGALQHEKGKFCLVFSKIPGLSNACDAERDLQSRCFL